MRKLYSFIIAIAVISNLFNPFITVNAYAADTSAIGFPLPANKAYSVTALANYSGGSSHASYLYTYGPVKNQTYNPYVVADIAASAGTSIYSVGDGTVITNKYGNGGGNYLVIAHDDGTYSYYGHMKAKSSYAKGNRVKKGAVVGYVGKTGTATGYHLHFEWSGHDPYCEYQAMGLLQTQKNSAASKYPHKHSSDSSSSQSTGTQNVSVQNNNLSLTGVAASNVAKNTAGVSASCSYAGTRPSSVGVYLGTSTSNMTQYGYDNINHGKTSFSIWYDLNGLSAGTTYYYQFYAVVNGSVIKSEVKSFTTQSEPKVEKPVVVDNLNLNVSGASGVTQNSARVDASCSYTGTRPSSVGVYLGTSTSNMTQYGYDNINHGKKSFSIWYDLNGLSAGTTYYYQFYAVVNGSVIKSEVRSFATKQDTSINIPASIPESTPVYVPESIPESTPASASESVPESAPASAPESVPASVPESNSNSYDISIPVNGVSELTSNSARVNAACSYSSSKPSSVGLYLGTSPSNMTYFDSDNINHNRKSFRIWYDISGLSSGTTYYYQFYAVVNGQTITTDTYSFTTN